MQPILRVDKVSKRFSRGGGWLGRPKSEVHAVSDVSFSLESGEVLGLVGESGSGKSTLGRLAIRLLQPSAGEIWFEGRRITALPARELRSLRRMMQLVFQDPYGSLNPRMTVGDTIAEGTKLHRLAPAGELKGRVAEALRRVGLPPELARRFPKALSGGQRQRVAIARALSVQPRLIVADEPVSALDVSIQAEIIELLQKLQAESSLSMLFISHDLRVVRQLASRVMVLYLGRVVETGPTEEVYRAPSHPYTEALLAAIPSHPGTPKRDRITLEGELPNPTSPPSGCVFHPRCPYALPACRQATMQLRPTAGGKATACIRDDLTLRAAD